MIKSNDLPPGVEEELQNLVDLTFKLLQILVKKPNEVHYQEVSIPLWQLSQLTCFAAMLARELANDNDNQQVAMASAVLAFDTSKTVAEALKLRVKSTTTALEVFISPEVGHELPTNH